MNTQHGREALIRIGINEQLRRGEVPGSQRRKNRFATAASTGNNYEFAHCRLSISIELLFQLGQNLA